MAVLTIRIFKNFGGRGSAGEWSNTYHVDTQFAVSSQDLVNFTNDLVAMERAPHLNSVNFLRATINTYQREAPGAVGDFSTEIGLDGVGLHVVDNADPGAIHLLPGEIVLNIKHSVIGGRSGHHSYRYCIGPNDWTGVGGAILITQARQNEINEALNHMRPEIAHPLPLVIPSKTATGLPSKPFSKISIMGAANRQLRQARRGKKKDSAPDAGTAKTPEEVQSALAKASGFIGSIAPELTLEGFDPVKAAQLVRTGAQIVQALIRLIRTKNAYSAQAEEVLVKVVPFL